MAVQVRVEREVFGSGENLLVCGSVMKLPAEISALAGTAQCVCLDPPFMTGEKFMRRRPYGEKGWKTGVPSPRYPAYEDRYTNEKQYLRLLRRLISTAHLLLNETGVFYLHLDWRMTAQARILCDRVFGKSRFLNEIIWAYESGGRSRKTFSRKHDNILLYAKGSHPFFDLTRVPLAREGKRNHMARGMDEQGRLSYRLLAGLDKNKDQSYFLCQLSQDQLSKAIFPIGNLLKSEVREIARKADLPSAEKKDSQGICFVGKVDLPTFLQQKLKSNEGNVVEVYDRYYTDSALYAEQKRILSSILSEGSDLSMITSYISEDKSSPSSSPHANSFDDGKVALLEDPALETLSTPVTYGDIAFETETYRSGKKHTRKTRYRENPWGKIIGTHMGAQFYTIGQRKGLGIGGHSDSVFVIHTDIDKNIILFH